MCQSVGRGLFGVFKANAPIRSVAQETAEGGQVLGGGDDEHLADTGQHEHRDGVINHGFVVDGDHLFGDALGDGVEACAGASGQYDSFHL